MPVPAVGLQNGGSRIDEIVLSHISFDLKRREISLHTCLSVTNDAHIFKSFDAIMLFEFRGNLFNSLVEGRPQHLSILSYEMRPIFGEGTRRLWLRWDGEIERRLQSNMPRALPL